jgi:hypothetical protein
MSVSARESEPASLTLSNVCLNSLAHSMMSNDEQQVINSLESAAHEAALADGLIAPDASSSSENKSKKSDLRRGKWTTEEEQYANRLIFEFKLGLLPLTEGTTLRTFLSKLLQCDPMRISKKFVGQNCIGKVTSRFWWISFTAVVENKNMTGCLAW